MGKAKKTNTSVQYSANNTNEISGQAETDIFIVLDELLEWAEKNLITLPQINRDTFSLRLLNSLINACSNTVTLRIADINFIGISLEFAKNVLDSINLENHKNLTTQATDTNQEGDDENVKEFENIVSAKIKPICRLMREITEWFFESQTHSLQYLTKENIASQDTTKDDVEVSKVITMAVPILFEKIFGIIHQIYDISKEKNLNIQTSLDNMKKLFASILQLYEINCGSKNIPWEADPPITVMIRATKNVLWTHTEKSGGLEEYLTVKEVPWIISLLLGVVMQHKSVFDRYLRNWRNENEKTSAKHKNDLSANIVKDASNGIMLSRALMKLRDFSSYRSEINPILDNVDEQLQRLKLSEISLDVDKQTETGCVSLDMRDQLFDAISSLKEKTKSTSTR